MQKGYRYRLYPTADEFSYLSRTAGCCRVVYNVLHHEAKEAHKKYLANPTKDNQYDVSGYAFGHRLPELKRRPEYSFLKEVSSVALVYAANRLGDAYSAFFKRVKSHKPDKKGFPQFKSRHGKRSFTLWGDVVNIVDGRLVLPKLKTSIAVRWHRELPSKPTSCTITIEPSGKVYASLVCEAPKPNHQGEGVVGIDLGLTTLIVTSGGEEIHGPKATAKYAKQLARAQRILTKKQKPSKENRRPKNREKARIRVAKIHEKIRFARQDTLHKATTYLVSKYRYIVVEGLRVKAMAKNRRLAKSVHDASFGMLLTMVKWKALHSERCTVVVADTFFPSTQICHVCHHEADDKLGLKDRLWTCAHCGTTHNRDHNASQNLKWIGDLYVDQYPQDSDNGVRLAMYAPDNYAHLIAERPGKARQKAKNTQPVVSRG